MKNACWLACSREFGNGACFVLSGNLCSIDCCHVGSTCSRWEMIGKQSHPTALVEKGHGPLFFLFPPLSFCFGLTWTRTDRTEAHRLTLCSSWVGCELSQMIGIEAETPDALAGRTDTDLPCRAVYRVSNNHGNGPDALRYGATALFESVQMSVTGSTRHLRRPVTHS